MEKSPRNYALAAHLRNKNYLHMSLTYINGAYMYISIPFYQKSY